MRASSRAAGRRRRARPSGATSRRRIDAVLAARRAGRPSGVERSRLSTPYWRSKPVAMPRLTIAVDMTARARMPGARNVTGCDDAGRFRQDVDEREEDQQPDGDAEGEEDRFAPAEGHGHLGPGLGLPGLDHVTRCGPAAAAGTAREGSGRSGAGSEASGGGRRGRQAQEHVLQAVAAGPQVGQWQVPFGQPGSQGGHRRRLGLGRHQIFAGVLLGHGAADPGGQRRRVQSRAGRRSGSPADAPSVMSSAGRAGRDHLAVVDDHDPVGEALGLLHLVGREQHADPRSPQIPDRRPGWPAGPGDRRRRWARPKRRPTADRPGPGPGRGAAARRRTAAATASPPPT